MISQILEKREQDSVQEKVHMPSNMGDKMKITLRKKDKLIYGGEKAEIHLMRTEEFPKPTVGNIKKLILYIFLQVCQLFTLKIQ